MLKIKLLKTFFSSAFLLLLATQSAIITKAQNTDSASLKEPQQNLIVDSTDTLVHQTSHASHYTVIDKAYEKIETPKVQLNPKAVSFVNNYLKDNDELLSKIKNKSAPYFKIIESLLRKNNLPVELKYLAVIESKLKSTAVSHAGAVGPWQLMPKTARSLGLKVNSKTDERTHYYRSTVAACKYIKDLYAMYGDWLLVIAAYNAGPGNVDKAIKRSGSRNFWYLQYHLPAETRAHVKRFIGAHYYFEKGGSETTLTKAELIAYKKTLSQFNEKLQQLTDEGSTNEVVED